MPKKTKNTKRISDVDDESVKQVDVQYNPDIATGLIQQLSQRVDLKCSQLQTDTDFMILQLQEQFKIELVQLPTDIKKMSMKTFREKFGDSLDLIPKGSGGFRLPSVQPSISRSQHIGNGVYQTPHAPCRTGDPRYTRAPREGEHIVSSNGSPLGEFNTVVKAPRDPSESIVPQTPGVFVPLRTGEIVDIENMNVENLDPSLREDALAKMQQMMSNMQKLMGKLKT